MATALKNLSEYTSSGFGDLSQTRIGIVVSEWNDQITNALFQGAMETLLKEGVKQENIVVKTVPGSFELPLGATKMFKDVYQTDEYKKALGSFVPDAVICLGCVIQGETRHFDFICNAVALGITEVGLRYEIPVIFGVLTTDNLQQAIDRSGGKHGNKGVEAAITALKML
ncbi:MAG: 6,7-dimethyl-8-ribityllumazine synthase [Bacteroidales bacterium]|jgi:6,7-dimethyl-8-ribityllumazine synthase|nr:6,7-dimethyl-8-ribityllumazine synthase [Bacteroidales bacterium]